MQAVWSSVWCWHAHIGVHRNPDFWHLQRRVLHCLRHKKATILRQLSDMGLYAISTGCISEGAGSSGVGQGAFRHIIAWSCTLVKWKRSASLVGAIASGFPVVENNKSCVASIESVLYTLYILQTNVSEDFMVSSVSSPMPKFLSKPWYSLKIFHDDRLVWFAMSEVVSHPVNVKC